MSMVYVLRVEFYVKSLRAAFADWRIVRVVPVTSVCLLFRRLVHDAFCFRACRFSTSHNDVAGEHLPSTCVVSSIRSVYDMILAFLRCGRVSPLKPTLS